MYVDISKFQYTWGENLVNFNSLSPDGKYFYQITKPKDMYWGLFVARISFLDLNRNLIHYDKSVFANPLQNYEQGAIAYAYYSDDGRFAYYQERIDLNTLNHVLIDLRNRKLKKAKWSGSMDSPYSAPDENRFSYADLVVFQKEQWTPTIIDKRNERNVLFKRVWKP